MLNENKLPEDCEGRYLQHRCDTCATEYRTNVRSDVGVSCSVANCSRCGDDLCDNCLKFCEVCQLPACGRDLRVCPECAEFVCAGCWLGEICKECYFSDNVSARTETILNGVIFCCALAVLGCVVGYLLSRL